MDENEEKYSFFGAICVENSAKKKHICIDRYK